MPVARPRAQRPHLLACHPPPRGCTSRLPASPIRLSNHLQTGGQGRSKASRPVFRFPSPRRPHAQDHGRPVSRSIRAGPRSRVFLKLK